MKRGAGWELQLERWHDLYRRERRALVFRTFPPITMHTDKDRKGQFRASFSGNAPPDFVGHVAAVFGDEARGVVFDAKEVQRGKSLPLSRIEPHQARDLEAATLQGAYAFIAARIGGVQVLFWWYTLAPWYWDRTRASAHIDDGVQFGDGGWLEVIGG